MLSFKPNFHSPLSAKLLFTGSDPGLIPGFEGPLEKEVTSSPSILAWKIPWTKEPGGVQPMGCKELDTTNRLNDDNENNNANNYKHNIAQKISKTI